MSYYIEILAVQPPFPLDYADSQNRLMFSCNFNCRAVYPVDSFEYEMAKIITDASLAILTVDLFIGPRLSVPDGPGPYTSIRNTGGRAEDWSHDSAYQNLSFQTLTIGEDYDEVSEKINSIYRLFNGLRSLTVIV